MTEVVQTCWQRHRHALNRGVRIPLAPLGNRSSGAVSNHAGVDVTARLTSKPVASIHTQKTTRGNTYRVLWRADGRQRSLTFENLRAGNPVRAQEFFNGGWKPGRAAAMKGGLTKGPRVHDLGTRVPPG